MSNTISGNAGVAGAAIALTGAATASTTSAADGTYSFAGLSAGAYVVTPTLAGVTFTPAFLDETLSGSDITDANFVAQATGYSAVQLASYDFTTKPDANPQPAPWEASGTGGAGLQNLSNVCIATAINGSTICEEHWDGIVFPNDQYSEITILSNMGTAAVGVRHGDTFDSGYFYNSDDNGDGTQENYIQRIESDGSLTILSDMVRSPEAPGDVLRLEVVGTLLTGFLNGVAIVSVTDSTYIAGQCSVDIYVPNALTDVQISSFRAGSIVSYSISGSVGAAGAGATITLSGTASATTTAAGGTGNYSFTGLLPGTYYVTPGLTGHAFSPSDTTVVITTADITGINFVLFTPSQSGSNSASIMASGPLFATRIVSPRTEIIGTNLGIEIRK